MSQTLIRNATLEDVDRIARRFVDDELCKPEGLEAKVRRSIERSPETCLVATDDTQCVGALLSTFNGFHVFLSHMSVSRAHQGKGTGRALHDTLVARASALGAAGIITDSWLTATGFYYELGYRLPGAVFLIRDVK